MSNLKSTRKCITCFTTISRVKTLCPNANVQKNSQEKYASSYIKFI